MGGRTTLRRVCLAGIGRGNASVGLGILPAILRLIRAGLFAGVRDEALRFRRVKRRNVVVLEERFEERGTLAGGLRRT